MDLLTILLVPAAFVYYSAGNRFSNLPTYRMAYGSGLACGMILAIFDAYVSNALPWTTPKEPVLYVVLLVSLVIIPFGIGPVILNLVFVSSVKDRIQQIVPQLFGILTVYLPYILITRFPVPDVWILIMFPVLLVSLLFLIDVRLKRYLFSIRLAPTLEGALFALLPVFVSLMILPVLVVLWHFCFHPLVFWIPSVVLTGFTAGMRIKKYI